MYAALGLSIASACGHPAAPTPVTGLAGIVLRGPVTPVCRIDVPCDLPFSADFSVEQNGVAVAGFRSDQDGRFTVLLAPGTYRIIPRANAPIILPAAQAKTVDVQATRITHLRLMFDTGIR